MLPSSTEALRIFDGTASGADRRDPAKAKATVVVRSTDLLTTAEATITVKAAAPDAPGGIPSDRSTGWLPSTDRADRKERTRSRRRTGT